MRGQLTSSEGLKPTAVLARQRGRATDKRKGIPSPPKDKRHGHKGHKHHPIIPLLATMTSLWNKGDKGEGEGGGLERDKPGPAWRFENHKLLIPLCLARN